MSRRVKDYFERVSSDWDTLRRSLYGDEVRDAVIKAVRLGLDDTVLDVGAGTGFLTEAAAKVAGKVVALDISKSMTDEAMSKLAGKNVEFKVGTAERIPLADASVDVVMGNMILHHCADPTGAVREMARVLRPGGRVALSDMKEHEFEWLRVEHADLWMGFKMRDVEEMMKGAGLKDVNVGSLGTCCSTESSEKRAEVPMFLATGVRP